MPILFIGVDGENMIPIEGYLMEDIINDGGYQISTTFPTEDRRPLKREFPQN